MDFGSDKKEPKNQEKIGHFGAKKYGRLLRMYREGCLSVCVYENAYVKKTFYDIVIFRKTRDKTGSYSYRRGTNLKYHDLSDLIVLLKAAKEYLASLEVFD